MFLSFSRPLPAIFLACLAFSGATLAQSPPSLREAVEAAWALSPHAHALPNRQAELEARQRAASSLIPGPAAVTLAHRTDRPGSNGGLREMEAELALPLWAPGVRDATSGQVRADHAAFGLQTAASKLKLASEVRELAAQAAIAQIELDLARRKLREAGLLAADVERRVKVGEVARVDLLQAQSVQGQAAAAQAQADGALARALALWRGLTGLARVSVLDENTGSAQEHPVIAAADAQVRAAQARLALADADRRDPMEVGLGVTRERAGAGAASETSMRISLRVPLGSHGRNAPKLAAARADVDAAGAEAQAARRSVEAELEAARNELAASRRAESLAAERERLGTAVQALVAKSYALGESDLPTRLRADSERFEAELAHARARAEARRAVSRLNQAMGLLP